MKYGVITLSILSIISIIGLGFNYHEYTITNDKVKDITNKIEEVKKEVDEIDKYLESNKNTYEEFKNNNKDKIELLEKWQRKQKEATEAL